MDRKAQVDLTKTSAQQAAAFPRFAGARSCEVVLRAGEVLFLPAFWWHEVLTEDIPPNELCVSVNFWFDVDLEKKLSIPLRPAMRLELSRELEKLVGLVCGTRHTAAFLEALIQQQREVQSGICRVLPNEHPPLGVDSCDWGRLLDFVLWKAALLLGPHQVLPFLENLCSPDRFRTCEARR
ncbi:hypothetical protein AB1Y20_022147 [Prymnesium parvum]|uniref:JmjC domain-containing protein n=1 Tax=Prymnesium parvum TaxID=97485 RepID=A0AB34JGH3_PRYPA